MSKALETAYASATDYVIHTLELKHPSFQGGAIRLCQGYDDLEATLETAETVTFVASGFGVSLPQRSIRGRQDLNFQLDNLTGEAIQQIDAANEAGGLIEVIYRPFVGADLSQPGNPPVKMVATFAQVTSSSVVVTASFHDLVNKAWPRRRYTPTFAPGLKYFG